MTAHTRSLVREVDRLKSETIQEEADRGRFHNALDSTLDLVGTSIRVGSGREEDDVWTEQVNEEMKNVEQNIRNEAK